jgi:hypothetical protein
MLYTTKQNVPKMHYLAAVAFTRQPEMGPGAQFPAKPAVAGRLSAQFRLNFQEFAHFIG